MGADEPPHDAPPMKKPIGIVVAIALAALAVGRTARAQCTGSNCGTYQDQNGNAVQCSCTGPQTDCRWASGNANQVNAGECCAVPGAACASQSGCGPTCDSETCVNGSCCGRMTPAQACSNAQATCGTAPDGCGGVQDCGPCPELAVASSFTVGQAFGFSLASKLAGVPITVSIAKGSNPSSVFTSGTTDTTGAFAYPPPGPGGLIWSAGQTGNYTLSASVGSGANLQPSNVASFAVSDPAPAVPARFAGLLGLGLAAGAVALIRRGARAKRA